MLEFKRSYNFYAIPEAERKALVGKVFKETGRTNLYFPIQLANGEFNYGKQQGVIFVSPIHKHDKHGKWFRVGAFSPDDLDRDLDFDKDHTHLRQEVIDFIRKANKHYVTYRGFLEAIQSHFQAGTFTS